MTAYRLFLLGVAVIALHVIDDSFLQPQRGTSAADHLVSGLVPLAAARARRLGLPAPARRPPGRARAGARRARARRERRGGALRGRRRRLHRASPRIPAGLLLLGLGVDHAVADAPHGTAGGSCAAPLLGVAGLLVFLFVVLPVGMAYVNVHVARAVVPAPHLGAPHENVTLTTSDGLKLQGLVRPVAQRRRGDRLPGPQGPAAAHADARPPRLRRAAASTAAARARARASSTSWGWGGERDLQGRDRVPAAPPRRRARPHRRARAVGRRRADDRGRRLHAGAEGRRVRGRRHALAVASCSTRPGAGEVDRSPRSRRSRPPRPPTFYNQAAAAEPDRPRREGRAAPAAAHVLRARPGRRDRAQPGLSPRGRRVRDAVGDPRRRPHRRHPRAAGGVRAARRRLLRRRAGASSRAAPSSTPRASCPRASATILVPWRMRSLEVWSKVTSTTSSGRRETHSSSRSLFQREGSPMPRSPVS